jgi:glycosyltransferase involved in cell wall biosynthesis
VSDKDLAKKLRGKGFLLATPMYGGMCHAMFVTSILRLQERCAAFGVNFEHCFMVNESLIDRARNGLVHEFLTQSKQDYLIFIDGDIQFNPDDILTLLAMEKDVIAIPCPKKGINWGAIIEAVRLGNDDPAFLAKLGGEYNFSALPDEKQDGPVVKVFEVGTGIMMIHRRVFDKMREAFPQNTYKSDNPRHFVIGKGSNLHAYFKSEIVDGRHLSEDFYFCNKWRELGGDIWLLPLAQTTHHGSYGFQGSVGHLAELVKRSLEARGTIQ